MRRFRPAFFLPFFRRLPFDLLRLFEQALPIELMSLGFRKDPALFFVDMMFDQVSEHLEPCIERGRTGTGAEFIQFVEQGVHKLMLLDGLVDHVGILKDCSKGWVDDALFDSGMNCELSDNAVRYLRFFPTACFG